MKKDTAKHDQASPLVGIILLILSILLVVGNHTFAAPCAMHDGAWGPCHWIERALLGVNVVLIVISGVRVFERDEGERRGLSFACACLGVLVALLPGFLIETCVDSTMACNEAMRPFVHCIGIVIALVGGTDLVMRLRAIGK